MLARFARARVYGAQTMLACEWTINAIFIFEIALKMVAKKWRPLKYFTAEDYKWTWNNFDFWVVVLSVLIYARATISIKTRPAEESIQMQ